MARRAKKSQKQKKNAANETNLRKKRPHLSNIILNLSWFINLNVSPPGGGALVTFKL